MSDAASQFNNHAMAALEKFFGVNVSCEFALVQWYMRTNDRAVVRTLKAMIQEERRNTQDGLSWSR